MADGDVLTPRLGVLAHPAPVSPRERRRQEQRRVEGRVSVIMPAFNVAPYIAEAVGSVLGQSHRQVELVVVDDGSTDGTRAILDDLAAADDRLQVHAQANSGPNAARNLALGHATGEFVTFLDGDDVVLPGAYERMVRSLRTSGSDFAQASYVRIRDGVQEPAAPWIRRAHAKEMIGAAVTDRPTMMVNAVQWSKVYRRSFWDESVREFALPGYYQDQLVSARAFGHARSVDSLTEPTVAWRARDDRSSMTQQVLSLANMRDRFRTARESLEILEVVSGRKLHDARLTHYLNNDFASTIRRVEEAPEDYWRALVEEVRGLLALMPNHEFWDRVDPQHKVVYHLIGDERRADVEAFNRAGGRVVRDFPVEECDDGYYVHLPLWEDTSIPRWSFRLGGRYARGLRDGGTWRGGRVAAG
ncbi:glycosyltransferase family 2 protein [Nocardioides sp. W7]|uniref:glycosyltransferase family 2 protein n=1 Tax=Nocardioides sp. W7 TaxID=2931390 RepID=UPI001FD4D1B8|nr:glycosyltransferase family 2 protein [Nocardioides sp. W7]